MCVRIPASPRNAKSYGGLRLGANIAELVRRGQPTKIFVPAAVRL
jgi:hypothetical protein